LKSPQAVARGLVQLKLKIPSSLATLLLWLSSLKAIIDSNFNPESSSPCLFFKETSSLLL
jgi:hypothetical protein